MSTGRSPHLATDAVQKRPAAFVALDGLHNAINDLLEFGVIDHALPELVTEQALDQSPAELPLVDISDRGQGLSGAETSGALRPSASRFRGALGAIPLLQPLAEQQDKTVDVGDRLHLLS